MVYIMVVKMKDKIILGFVFVVVIVLGRMKILVLMMVLILSVIRLIVERVCLKWLFFCK